jgi:protein phosphatase 2C family protein 2/3
MQGWRKYMEDTSTIETNIPGFLNYNFFGVYDGHRGKTTSKYISKNLHLNIFKKIHELGEENIEKAIKDSFMQTDSEWKVVITDGDNAGSAAVIAVITPNRIVYVGNAGDSRAVMSVAGLAVPLSEDHRPNNNEEKERIIKEGGDPYRYSLTRAFGDFDLKNKPNKKPEEQEIIACPDVKFYKIEAECDFLILACDGIWDGVKSSQEVVDFINREIWLNNDLSKACENLMDYCSKITHDNTTIIVIGFLHGLEKEQWLKQTGLRCRENCAVPQESH